jgi:hypothetical protein
MQQSLPFDGEHPGPLFKPGCPLKASARNTRSKLYRLKVKRATPPWADKRCIRQRYKQAKKLTAETGVPHTVDHIIPLKGELVCGLHVHYNLRVLPMAANLKKGNSFVEQEQLWPTSTGATGAERGTPSGTPCSGTSESPSAETAVMAAFTQILSVSTEYLAGAQEPTSGDHTERAQHSA